MVLAYLAWLVNKFNSCPWLHEPQLFFLKDYLKLLQRYSCKKRRKEKKETSLTNFQKLVATGTGRENVAPAAVASNHARPNRGAALLAAWRHPRWHATAAVNALVQGYVLPRLRIAPSVTQRATGKNMHTLRYQPALHRALLVSSTSTGSLIGSQCRQEGTAGAHSSPLSGMHHNPPSLVMPHRRSSLPHVMLLAYKSLALKMTDRKSVV